MSRQSRRPALALILPLVLSGVLAGITVSAQNRQNASSLRGVPSLPPPDRPVILQTAEQPRIRLVPIATGLSHPWGFTFRRNGDILVTERDRAALRVIRNGVTA